MSAVLPPNGRQDSPRSSFGDRPKHRRRPSGSLSSFSGLSRRHSSSLPPADLPQAEAGVLQQLTAEERGQLVDDGEVARYVKACNGSQAEALKRLRATFDWRSKEQPQSLSCTVCEKDPSAHFMHVVGHDQLGRPVIYSCLKNVTDRKTEHNRLHMIATFEQAIRMMPPGVTQWTWCSDFAGFGYRDVDPSMARIFLNVSAEHYPERLGHFFVLDSPHIFTALWKCVQPWVDPVTKAKVTFCNFKPEAHMEAVMQRQHLGSELIGWLREEMAENRNSKKLKTKVYSYAGLEKLVQQPNPAEAAGGGHCVYGTPSLLKFMGERPHVLSPQPRVKAAT